MIDTLPDATLVAVPLAWLRKRLQAATVRGPEYGTTGEVAKAVGRTAKFWRLACEAGEVAGAWQDSDGGPWTIPLDEARAHLERLSAAKAPLKRIRPRGPWKKAS